MPILKDAMPDQFCDLDKSWKFAEVEIKRVNCSISDGSAYRQWPGTHKNVHSWVELENGYAVGWNENPARGYSFPSIKMKK